MATIQEVFAEYILKFDYEEFEKANKEVDKLEKNIKDSGTTQQKAAGKSQILAGKVGGLADALGKAGVSAGFLASAAAFLTNPLTIIGAVIGAVIFGLVSFIAAIKKAATSIYNFTSALAQIGSELASVSERLNISTEAITAFRQAASESNKDIGLMDDALTDLTEKMGDAIVNPTSEVAKTFKRLGITIKDLKNESTEEIFLRVADALSKVESDSKKVFLANQLMSEAGRQLIPVFNGGRKELEAYVEQVRQSQPELAEFIENSLIMTREQAKLNLAWEGTKQILFNALAPAVIWAVEKVREFVVWLNQSGAAQAAVKTGLLALVTTFAIVTGVIATVITAAMLPMIIFWGAIALAVAAVILVLQDFYVFLKGGDSIFERFIGLLFDTKYAILDFLDSFFESDVAVGFFLDQLSNLINGLFETYNSLARLVNLPEIKVDIRRSIRDQLLSESERDPEARARKRVATIEGVRRGLQRVTGVEGFESEDALLRRRLNFAGLLPQTNLTPQQLASPAVLNAARERAGRSVNVQQTNAQRIEISSLANVQEVQAALQEVNNNQIEQIRSSLGSPD